MNLIRNLKLQSNTEGAEQRALMNLNRNNDRKIKKADAQRREGTDNIIRRNPRRTGKKDYIWIINIFICRRPIPVPGFSCR